LRVHLYEHEKQKGRAGLRPARPYQLLNIPKIAGTDGIGSVSYGMDNLGVAGLQTLCASFQNVVALVSKAFYEQRRSSFSCVPLVCVFVFPNALTLYLYDL